MTNSWEKAGFGLYIHWPFCQAKCPYCDFNSHVVSAIDQASWAKAYVSEITRVGEETAGRVLKSVFFGGGTPSLMEPQTVESILNAVRKTWSLSNDVEITLEANPTSIEANNFAGYRMAGVNRISMGAQALNDADLKALGRLHSAKEAIQAFDIARQHFDRVSFDLIYARQNQTLPAWKAELEQALSLAIDHLSLYQLTIEDGTAFGDRYAAGKLRNLPDEDLAADMFEVTQEICTAHGMPAYEVSNHAKPGSESVHNLIYWTYGDYIGIGPGAHGRVTINGTKHATVAPRSPGLWKSQVENNGNGEEERIALDQSEQLTECLLMGLRLRDGIPIRQLNPLGISKYINNINYLEEIDLLKASNNRLLVTAKGRPVLNSVLNKLLNG